MKDLLDVQIIPYDTPNKCYSIDDMPLAYAYVPYQTYETPYAKEKALKVGTIFPSLNKPYGVYGNEFHEREGGKAL